MNERILELRTQAAAWVAKNHQPQDPNAYSQKEIDQRYLMYEEKFAELIVRECLEQIYSVTIDNPTDDWDQGYDSGLNQAAETIKEHFGVE